MKYKILILLIITVLSTYLIYTKNYQKRINITSINSLEEKDNYNKYLSYNLSKTNYKYNFNIDYTNKSLEIENLLGKIQNNDNDIQSIIHSSDILIISLGNNDIKTEEQSIIIKELKDLFKEIRKYNTKEIIYISPYNILSIKEICKKYNIKFIYSKQFDNPKLLAHNITKHIKNIYDNNVNNNNKKD